MSRFGREIRIRVKPQREGFTRIRRLRDSALQVDAANPLQPRCQPTYCQMTGCKAAGRLRRLHLGTTRSISQPHLAWTFGSSHPATRPTGHPTEGDRLRGRRRKSRRPIRRQHGREWPGPSLPGSSTAHMSPDFARLLCSGSARTLQAVGVWRRSLRQAARCHEPVERPGRADPIRGAGQTIARAGRSGLAAPGVRGRRGGARAQASQAAQRA